MTRDFLRELGVTDDSVITRILNEIGKDTNAAKAAVEKASAHEATIADLQAKLDTATANVKSLETNIAELTTASEKGADAAKQLEALQTQVAKEKAEREELEKSARVEAEHKTRFATVSEGSKWTNDLTRDGVYRQFVAALADETHKGKGDADIYKALTTDKEGYFANPNPPPDGAPIMPLDKAHDPIDAALRRGAGLTQEKKE